MQLNSQDEELEIWDNHKPTNRTVAFEVLIISPDVSVQNLDEMQTIKMELWDPNEEENLDELRQHKPQMCDMCSSSANSSAA